jgi:hypothetical protein
MPLTDQEFRDEYKPLQIPSAYHPDDTQENKILFALAELGDAGASEVVDKLEELEPAIRSEQLSALTKQVLKNWYDKGLIKGAETDGVMQYNLSKITQANDGAVDPDKLAPGLD